MRRILMIGLAVFAIAVPSGISLAAEHKSDVCHFSGNGKSQTLSVGGKALNAHLAHGDTAGACSSGSGS